jgi:hypothetical protein
MPVRKFHGRSKAGVELPDDVLERMAEEAGQGLDVTKLRRASRTAAMGSPGGLVSGAPRAGATPRSRRACGRGRDDGVRVREALRRYLKLS